MKSRLLEPKAVKLFRYQILQNLHNRPQSGFQTNDYI